MTNEQAVYRRVLRRETHPSRTGASVVVASILSVLLIAAIIVCVWVFVSPSFREGLTAWFTSVSSALDEPVALIVAGLLAVLLAVLLLCFALLPGRRARRGRTTDRVALLVDDGVLADAVAHAVAARCGIGRGQVSATIDRRVVTVRLTPTSGVLIDQDAANESAEATLATIGFSAKPKLIIARQGVIS